MSGIDIAKGSGGCGQQRRALLNPSLILELHAPPERHAWLPVLSYAGTPAFNAAVALRIFIALCAHRCRSERGLERPIVQTYLGFSLPAVHAGFRHARADRCSRECLAIGARTDCLWTLRLQRGAGFLKRRRQRGDSYRKCRREPGRRRPQQRFGGHWRHWCAGNCRYFERAVWAGRRCFKAITVKKCGIDTRSCRA